MNNAGILGPSPQPALDAYPLDAFEDVHRVNVIAPLASDPARRCPPCRPTTEPWSTSRRTPPSSPTRVGAATARRRRHSSSYRRSWRRSDLTSASGGSTPATCARRCIRRPSRARTSPTVLIRPTVAPAFVRLARGTHQPADGSAWPTGPKRPSRKGWRDGPAPVVAKRRDRPAYQRLRSTSCCDAHPPLDFASPARSPRAARARRPAPATTCGLLVASAGEPVGPPQQHPQPGGLAAEPGDLLVVNTSATLPAALTGGGTAPWPRPHRAGARPSRHTAARRPVAGRAASAGCRWQRAVARRLRRTTASSSTAAASCIWSLRGDPLRRSGGTRLWVVEPDLDQPVESYLVAHGRPIQYRATARPVGIDAYQSIFSRTPGSAEMPSAARPFTAPIVADLVTHGVLVAPLLLHTGVSSLEEGEEPPIERYDVPAATAALVDHVHDHGGRVVAVGTTVVRALETTADECGRSIPGRAGPTWSSRPQRPTRGRRRPHHRLARAAVLTPAAPRVSGRSRGPRALVRRERSPRATAGTSSATSI